MNSTLGRCSAAVPSSGLMTEHITSASASESRVRMNAPLGFRRYEIHSFNSEKLIALLGLLLCQHTVFGYAATLARRASEGNLATLIPRWRFGLVFIAYPKT